MPLATPRIAGVDAACGLALLGMFSVHVFGAFEPDGAPTVAWQSAGGRSSAAFALVAGVGLAFTTGARTPASTGVRSPRSPRGHSPSA
ncbi:hypothetical protein [Streptomyces turgidiscabies]|uniref:Membrane protein n=1 Tax=Streptomyces turgidiscabies TaxID=85558 RepID=A0ABU0RZH3_9ACTN|nr:hypothetical protein [Streptomyces turgidiscabies]MDQ0937355.1 putative membrane protein [Streptomyces turgidiscabies]